MMSSSVPPRTSDVKSAVTPAEPKLEARHVEIEYYVARSRRTFPVLKDLELSVHEGEFVAIVGPSGCGKSTFLSAAVGLLPVKGGEILIDGKRVLGPGKHPVAMVFQSAALLPWRNVAKNISYGLEIQGRPAREIASTVSDLVDLVGLNAFEHSFPAELSGGMQQRVNLARALAVDPELLLLDEPFAALDARTRELMQSELLRIWQAKKKTAVFVTHQIDEAVYLADRVVVFGARPGRVELDCRIDLPRPRTLDLKRTTEFFDLADRIAAVVETQSISQTEPRS
jgi:NitT/TauT family transport system ATP-binding protein